MGTEVLKSYDSLQNELQQARTILKGLNENIKKIVGRDPPDSNLRKRTFSDRRNEHNNLNERMNRERQIQINRDSGNLSPPPTKRRSGNLNDNPKSVFSRLSAPRDERPKLLSRVIRELPSREDIVAAQGADAESRARNRRMFGCLLGTLQKFCQEESRLKPKEEKKAQIEKKLEEQEIQERENLKKERQTLFSDRKKQQQQIRILEFKMNRMKELKEWEESKKPLANFIRTKSKPYIYYIPKTLDKKSQQKLKEHKEQIEKMIEKKRQDVQEELVKFECRFKSIDGESNNNRSHMEDPDEDEYYSDEEEPHHELTSAIVTSPHNNLKTRRENDCRIKLEKTNNYDSEAPLPKIASTIISPNTQSTTIKDEKFKFNENV